MNAEHWPWVWGVFVLAGAVKGVTGLGLPTVAMGLLSLTMPAAAAASLMLVPSLLTNAWQYLGGPGRGATLRRLAGMNAGVVIGTLWSVLPPMTGGHAWTKALVGGVLAAYGALGLGRLRFTTPRAAQPWLGPLVGYLTGSLTAASGIFVVPAVPYLQSLDLSRDELVQALGLSFTVSTLALALRLWPGSAVEMSVVWMSSLAVLPALAGMAGGQWLRARISEEGFRRCFFAGLVALGLYMLFDAWCRVTS